MKSAQTYSWILTKLKDAGHKVTGPRRSVAEYITQYSGVFSPNEIIEQLEGIDRVTIYRVLELFESMDIIHPVLSHHGERHYEMHGERHHHHVVCTGCERASCIDCEISRKQAKGFTNIHHSVVFTGLCDMCMVAAS